VDPPEGGDTAVIVTFGPGIRDETGLVHVAPEGMQLVRDVSTYRTSGDASMAVLGVAGDGCYRVSIPAFDEPDASVGTADVILEFRP
jgi:hypothetical protein